jgi:ribosome-binding factor A
MTSSRKERVAESVREAVASILQEEIHAARTGFVTVTHVKISPDLRHARVFVSVLAGGELRETTMHALEAATGFVRHRVGQTLRLRHTPEIVFELDESIEESARIESLLNSLHDGTEPGGSGEPPAKS